jgi:hypothetical protein
VPAAIRARHTVGRPADEFCRGPIAFGADEIPICRRNGAASRRGATTALLDQRRDFRGATGRARGYPCA